MKINTKLKTRDIELTGLFGEFELANKDIVIKFFCTNANSREQGSNESEFLEELKPMRERVDASSLSDMEALMQRDLNDFRVANNLIPYILGENSDVSFFPSILAVIMPKDYLNNTKSEYPFPDGLDASIINYNNLWSVEFFKDADDKPMNIGKFTFNKSESNIIVIDGQHRANAFRYASGVANATPSIYDAFYGSIDKNSTKAKIKNADLPVTLIWFENKVNRGIIDPRIISRKLFVDVNNNAKKINKSRSILLNETDITCISTRVFFGAIAERGFNVNEFSLLHSGFDVDSDLKNSLGHPLTLTTPEIIEYILSWVLLGSKNYETLSIYKVTKQRDFMNVAKFQQITKFTNIEKKSSYEGESNSFCLSNTNELGQYISIFQDLFQKPLLIIYSNLNVYKIFSSISKEYQENVYPNTGVEQQAIWNKAFKGGEGLYYSINMNVRNPNTMIQTYKKAQQQVEEQIKKLKLKILDSKKDSVVKAFFEAITSKAFQVGVVMAFESFFSNQAKKRKLKNREEAVDIYLELLNNTSIKQWVYIFSEFKQHLPELKDTDPKSWPAYHKLILFLIHDDKFQSFDLTNWNDSPYGKVVKNKIEYSLNVFKENNPDSVISSISDIPRQKITSWQQEINKIMNNLVEGIGKKDVEGVKYDEKVINFINKFFK